MCIVRAMLAVHALCHWLSYCSSSLLLSHRHKPFSGMSSSTNALPVQLHCRGTIFVSEAFSPCACYCT